MTSPQHAVLVPVKPPAHGKSRLVGLADGQRRELATAFALDTLVACLSARAVGAVLVVTDDAAFADRAAALGCTAIPDGVTGDLNGTLRQAAAEARRRWPHLAPVALCADLPALRPGDLDAALARAGTEDAVFVPDREERGTTLYAAPHDRFAPRFGPGSRLAHLGSGARELEDAASRLRCDVDDAADLERALALGVGPHTRAVETARTR